MAKNKPTGDKTPKPKKEADFRNFVTHEDLNNLQSKIIDAVKEIVASRPTEQGTSSDISKTQVPENDGSPNEEDTLQPQHRKIFEKYFDPEDGFDARFKWPETDDKGVESGGITFTIIVPEKFSNVTDAYKKQHKVDMRTRALQAHAIAKGIEDWCKAVARNLKYNKLTKTK